MRVGRMKFNPDNNRYGIWWDNDWFHPGLHCGECLEVMLEGHWVQTRFEMAECFFLVGTPYRDCLETSRCAFDCGGRKMARSLFLKDGSTKLIFHEDDRLNVLAGLIQEYLGKDCEELFYSIFEDKYANTGDDYERIADGYLSMLRDILDELDAILLCFDAVRLDRRKVYRALRQCRDNLHNNL